MKMNQRKFSFLLILIVLSLSLVPLFSQNRYFDNERADDGKKILSICHPSMGSISSILGLFKEGFLPDKGIVVVCLYHEDQTTDYETTKNFIKSDSLGYLFRFHEVRGSLSPENIYEKNACTAEFKNIFNKSDALILFGGADMPPELYGRKTNLLSALHTPFRHYFELSLVFHLLGGSQDKTFRGFMEDRPDFPLLGLCLGEQSINVGTGGTLIQDIWSEVYKKKTVEDVIALGREKWHNNPWPKIKPLDGLLRYNMHRIKLIATGKFVKKMGFSTEDTPWIVSSHHQMAGKLGKNIKVIATSIDGKVIEAIEHTRFPNVLGTQFHPEFSTLYAKNKSFRIEPTDKPHSLRSVLENNPPSYTFHKEIWAWFQKNLMGS